MADNVKNIMVVDDDTVFLGEMQEMLESYGYHAITAATCGQALALARTCHPDACLLDLKLGTASGFQLALRLRHAPETGGVPIVAMTGYFNVDTCGRMIAYCGIAACLQKPFHPREVILAIEQPTAAGPDTKTTNGPVPNNPQTKADT
jgi:CheY-like chemotaxis protein